MTSELGEVSGDVSYFLLFLSSVNLAAYVVFLGGGWVGWWCFTKDLRVAAIPERREGVRGRLEFFDVFFKSPGSWIPAVVVTNWICYGLIFWATGRYRFVCEAIFCLPAAYWLSKRLPRRASIAAPAASMDLRDVGVCGASS